MNLNNLVHLGKPIILEMYFANHSDKYIHVGQWIILWDEIPARKIGPGLYEVYEDTMELKIETPEDRLSNLIFELGETRSLLDDVESNYTVTKKYVRTPKGTKRMRPWEGSYYF